MNKEFWDKIYSSKSKNELSWYEDKPSVSLDLINSLNLNKEASILNVGGGNSNLAISLEKLGYTNVSVIDISSVALDQAKSQEKSNVKWIEGDVLNYQFDTRFDLWYDRAFFHFLNDESDLQNYINRVNDLASKYLIIGAFSKNGPEKCSDLEIRQYNEEEIANLFKDNFDLHSYFLSEHRTPNNLVQEFIYCTLFNKN